MNVAQGVMMRAQKKWGVEFRSQVTPSSLSNLSFMLTLIGLRSRLMFSCLASGWQRRGADEATCIEGNRRRHRNDNATTESKLVGVS
jgi:hypothetical protein